MKMNIIASALTVLTLASCSDEIEMRYPPKYELPELPEVGEIHTYKAPLYWSVYEYCIEQERGCSKQRYGPHGSAMG